MISFEKNKGNHAVKVARDHVAEIAGKWPIDLNDVLVVTSELVTNALLHAKTDVIQVGAWAIEKDGRGLYSVEVWDRDDESLPELHEPSPGPDAGGRPGTVACPGSIRQLGRPGRRLGRKARVRGVDTMTPEKPAANAADQHAASVTPDACVHNLTCNHEVMLAHARALRPGYGGVLHGDVTDLDGIVDHPAAADLIDTTQPMPSSHTGLCHLTSEHDRGLAVLGSMCVGISPAPPCVRSPAGLEAFYDGLVMIPPGLVSAPAWRPDPGPWPTPTSVDLWCGVGVLP